MVHAFRAADLIDGEVGAHWHTLVDRIMACRGERVGPFLAFSTSSAGYLAMASNMLCAMRLALIFIARLHHWWELELLIVEVVRLLTSVSLSVAGDLLIELYS